MTNLKSRSCEEIEIDNKNIIQNNPLRIRSLPEYTEVDFYLIGEIDDISDYIDFLRSISNLKQGDIVNLHINCYGGDVVTAFNILDVLQTTQADIKIFIEGCCCSAATFIALSGDSWEVMPHSYFMCHAYSSFQFGKKQELEASNTFNKKWLDNSIREIYKGFLSDDELERMMRGEDFYFNVDEVVERLANYKKSDIEKQELTQKICDKYQKIIQSELTKELEKFDRNNKKSNKSKK